MLLILALQAEACHAEKSQKRLRLNLPPKKTTPPLRGFLQVAQTSRKFEKTASQSSGMAFKERVVEDDNNNIVYLPTTYLKRPVEEKSFMRDLNTAEDSIVNTVESGLVTSHFIKGLESKHTSYYFEDIPTPYTFNSCISHLDKLPTMVTKGSGLGGAMICIMPKKQFQSTMGISTNGGQQQYVNFYSEKNNRFFAGVLAYDNDGGWN